MQVPAAGAFQIFGSSFCGADKIVFSSANYNPILCEWWGKTGTSDDTLPISAAITAAEGINGKLRFLPGSYYYPQLMSITSSNLEVEAKGAIIIQSSAASNSPLLFIAPSPPTGAASKWVRWRGGVLQAKQSATNPTTDVVLIEDAWCADLDFDGIMGGDGDPVTGNGYTTAYAQNGIHVVGSLSGVSTADYYSRIRSLYIDGVAGNGILMENPGGTVGGENVFDLDIPSIQQCGTGLNIQGGSNIKVWSSVEDNTTGVILGPYTEAVELDLHVENNTADWGTLDPASAGLNSFHGTCTTPADSVINYFKVFDYSGDASVNASTARYLNNPSFINGALFQSANPNAVVASFGQRPMPWVANTPVALGQMTYNPAYRPNYEAWFLCTTAGTTGSSAPSWNMSSGATTTDGSVTWTCIHTTLPNPNVGTYLPTVGITAQGQIQFGAGSNTPPDTVLTRTGLGTLGVSGGLQIGQAISVTGTAGGTDGSPNGTYIYEGTYNGNPYYANGTSWYIWWDTAGYWRLTPVLGVYAGAPNWAVAPPLSGAWSEGAGGGTGSPVVSLIPGACAAIDNCGNVTANSLTIGTTQVLTPGSTVAISAIGQTCFTLTPAQTETITVSGGRAQQDLYLLITTSGTTTYTLTFSTGFHATSTLATGTTSGKVFMMHFKNFGGTFYEVSSEGPM